MQILFHADVFIELKFIPFSMKTDTFYLHVLMNRKFKIIAFINILNVFTVIFDLSNVLLINKSIKKKEETKQNIWKLWYFLNVSTNVKQHNCFQQ